MIINPYFEIWLAMMLAATPVVKKATPEERRANFLVIDGGKAA